MAAILVIEDEQRIRESLATRLSERGHDVETVARALEGIEGAISGDYDVVVLDLGLPDLDGVEALRMIRAVSQVPVVVATARDDEQDIIDRSVEHFRAADPEYGNRVEQAVENRR